jgi:fructosamine-3-kinase
MTWKTSVLAGLSKHLGKKAELFSDSSVGGGDINEAYRFQTNAGDFFVKKNSASRYPEMFRKEAMGLQLLEAAGELPVPQVVIHGEEADTAFLVLKFVKSGSKSDNFWDLFGTGMAKLHKHSSEAFGLDHDNYIGSLFQSNRQHDNWIDFFREERLNVQVKMARDEGIMGRDTIHAFERFYNRLDEIFPMEPPSLVHGDLWGGNYMSGEKGEPVLIDPAVYFGHREMDIGMSRLFGGFSKAFYEAYQTAYPLAPGWQQRVDFCNLYPLMVHVNLFGGGYINSVRSILSKF